MVLKGRNAAGSSSAGVTHGHLEKDDLPVFGGVAFVDVPGESRRAVERGGAELARKRLGVVVQQAQVSLQTCPVGQLLSASGARETVRGAQIEWSRALTVLRGHDIGALRGAQSLSDELILERLVSQHVLPQVCLAFEPLPAMLAVVVEPVVGTGLWQTRTRGVSVAGEHLGERFGGLEGLFGRVWHARFVPAPVGGQVRRTAEDLLALGTPVLHPHYPGALVLCQRERVRVFFSAKLANELPQGLVGVARGRSGLQLHGPLFDFQAQHRGCGDLVLEVEFAYGFGLLGAFAAFTAVRGRSFGAGADDGHRSAPVAVAGADFQVDRREQKMMVQAGERGGSRKRLGRDGWAEVETPLEIFPVVLLADRPGGAVQGLVHRLRIAELHRLGAVDRHRRLCSVRRERWGNAVRLGGTGRGWRPGELRDLTFWSVSSILIRAYPVRNERCFLVPFHQESFGHDEARMTRHNETRSRATNAPSASLPLRDAFAPRRIAALFLSRNDCIVLAPCRRVLVQSGASEDLCWTARGRAESLGPGATEQMYLAFIVVMRAALRSRSDGDVWRATRAAAVGLRRKCHSLAIIIITISNERRQRKFFSECLV